MSFRIGTIAAEAGHFGRAPVVAPVTPVTPAESGRGFSQGRQEPRAAAHKAEPALAAFAPAAFEALIQLQSEISHGRDGRDGRDEGRGLDDRGRGGDRPDHDDDRADRAWDAIEDVLERLRDRWPGWPPRPPVTPPPVTPPPVVQPPAEPPPVVVQPPPAPAPAPVVDSPYPAQRLRAVLEEIRKPVVAPGTTEPFSQRGADPAVAPLTLTREQAITLRSLGQAYQGQAALAVMKVAGADALAFQRSLWA